MRGEDLVVKSKLQREDGQFDIELSNGAIYIGELNDLGELHGHCQITWCDGTNYNGDIEVGKISGNGEFIFPDKSKYTGEVSNGAMHGKGIFLLETETKYLCYEGDFENGKREGSGIIYFNKDRTSYYKGDFKEDKRDGKGEIVYKSGNIYNGDWENNMKSGNGIMKWKKVLSATEKELDDEDEDQFGEIYTGSWKDDKQSGKGMLIFTESKMEKMCNIYAGNWENGLQHGEGKFLFSNGSVLRTTWKNGLKEGHGELLTSGGIVYQCDFELDRMVKPQPHGNALRVSFGNMFEEDICFDTSFDETAAITREKRSVHATLMRWNSELSKVYREWMKHFAPEWLLSEECDLTEDETIKRMYFTQGKMSMAQFWMLLRHLNIWSSKISLGKIAELWDDIQSTETVEPFRMDEFKDLYTGSNPHTPIVFREFCELLLRVAYHYNSHIPLLSGRLDSLLEGSFVNALVVRSVPFLKWEGSEEGSNMMASSIPNLLKAFKACQIDGPVNSQMDFSDAVLDVVNLQEILSLASKTQIIHELSLENIGRAFLQYNNKIETDSVFELTSTKLMFYNFVEGIYELAKEVTSNNSIAALVENVTDEISEMQLDESKLGERDEESKLSEETETETKQEEEEEEHKEQEFDEEKTPCDLPKTTITKRIYKHGVDEEVLNRLINYFLKFLMNE
eukprot:TRINITY_DN259901_c0_g1_i1.p1 TRINITY_DN259901_c0_g1~~TRINITY_DN259901_c0_g1_i1.p1  ORF type:complete len:680 (+),score=193.23 TRINITY_DN259901_c0_g1_i1:92-2131(+)